MHTQKFTSHFQLFRDVWRIKRFTPHSPEVALQVGHCEQRKQREWNQVEQGRLRSLEHLRADSGGQQAKEVPRRRVKKLVVLISIHRRIPVPMSRKHTLAKNSGSTSTLSQLPWAGECLLLVLCRRLVTFCTCRSAAQNREAGRALRCRPDRASRSGRSCADSGRPACPADSVLEPSCPSSVSWPSRQPDYPRVSSPPAKLSKGIVIQ